MLATPQKSRNFLTCASFIFVLGPLTRTKRELGWVDVVRWESKDALRVYINWWLWTSN